VLTGIMLLMLNPKTIMLFMAILIFISIAISAVTTKDTKKEVHEFSV